MNDHHGIGIILNGMGSLAHETGDADQARRMLSQGLSIMQNISCTHCSARLLMDLARVAVASADYSRSATLLGAAAALRDRSGIIATPSTMQTIEDAMGKATPVLGVDGWESAWREGWLMSLEQAAVYATTFTELG